MAQSVAVFLLVGLCALYAASQLMPAALRRVLARGLLRLRVPLPSGWRASLMQVAAGAQAGCGCSGCDQATAGAAPKARPLVFHPRK